MHISATQDPINACQTDMLIIGCFQDQNTNSTIEQLDSDLQQQLSARIKHKDFTGKAGQTLTLYKHNGQRIEILGLGENKKCYASQLLEFTKKVAALAAKTRCQSLTSYVTALSFENIKPELVTKLVCLGSSYAAYRYEDTKSFKEDNIHEITDFFVFSDSDQETFVTQAAAISTGVLSCRHLANSPPNICNPQYIADFSTELCSKLDNCSINVLNKAEMEEMGMGSLLAVARGSANEPKLVVLNYQGADKNTKPFALVGKGITFDTGGISLKPGANMDEMKYDMGGAASVIGAFHAVAELQLPINLITIVAAVENMPDGDAYRPGDVVTSYSGKTIEVLNTDAEGRMILCDALTYAQEFKPQVTLDLATLTGACVVALGHHASAVMTKTEGLAEEIINAGSQIHDRAWQLPLWDDYQKQLDTTFADMQNIGGFPAGTITAGCFLSRFTEGQNWAHIDIAGTAWNSKKEGSTGRPVAMLTQYFINQSKT